MSNYIINARNTIIVNTKDNYAIIITNKKEEVFIDIDDIEKVKNSTWYINGARHKYAVAKIKNKHVKLHRLIMNVLDMDYKTVQVDHINGNTLDNRKCNLRLVTPQQNSFNKSKNNFGKNKHNGVHYMKDKCKWRAYITYNGKWIHIGMYETEDEAIITRIKAEEKYYGEYRRKS